jgi:VWFA-related protein
MIAALLLAAQASTPEPPRFPVAVDQVYVDVFVTRRGAPVAGLRPADFELRDDGVVQQVVLVDRGAAPLGAALVLDTSESVRGAKLEGLRAAARAFGESLHAQDEIALVAFSHAVRLVSRDRDELATALDGLSGRSSTSLYDAIYAGARLPMAASRRLLVVFSDGDDNTSWLSVEDVEAVLRTAGLLLYTVRVQEQGAAAGPGRDLLRRLAGATGGRLLEPRSHQALREAFGDVIEDLRGGYVLGYTPRGVAPTGDHRLEVRVRRPGLTVRARGGYRAGAVRRPGR